MKIAVATDDGINVAGHTGRCQGFVIFEIADGIATRLEYRPNAFTAHARGECAGDHAPGAQPGHHSHGPLLEAIGDCSALVSRGMGPRLKNDLAARGIDALVTRSPQVEQTAEEFASGRLQRVADGGTCTQS